MKRDLLIIFYAVIFVAASLVGCTPQRQYVYTGQPSAFDMAYYECERDMNLAQPGINGRLPVTSTNPYSRIVQRSNQMAMGRRFMENCMNAKGYALQ